MAKIYIYIYGSHKRPMTRKKKKGKLHDTLHRDAMKDDCEATEVGPLYTVKGEQAKMNVNQRVDTS